MALKLQTTDGKTKTYQTERAVGGGENVPDKYVSKCGRDGNLRQTLTKHVIILTVPLMFKGDRLMVGRQVFWQA